MSTEAPIHFAAVGLNHGHIYAQVNLLLRAGAVLSSFYAAEADLAARFAEAYPQARAARSLQAILEDKTIALVISAGIPDERAALGVQAMRHGKDFMSDKPAFTSLEMLEEVRRVQTETGRIFSICYSERFESRSTVRAGELIEAGVIGRVVQTIGMGPHRINLPTRPGWFFQRERYGGILADIGSHQMDQFLFFTGSHSAEVSAAQVANWKYAQYPGLEDFGEVMLRGSASANGDTAAIEPTATGYVRVDWYTPDGLATWGDGRLFLLGTDGYMEIRKYIDLAGRPGDDHLFWVDARGTHYEDCSNVELPYGRQLIDDIRQRTETAMTQKHCFLASELALRAEAQALRLGNLSSDR